MRPDIVNLRQFYSSRLGRKAQRRLQRINRDHWPHEHGLHIVGVGYATDLLPSPHAPEQKDSRILALMPMAQGAMYWPVNHSNHSALGDEMRPPFITSSLHRVLMAHSFEHATAPDELLRIWWQLLAPGGRLMLIVPNRRGLWARFSATPFATGTPYTFAMLKQLLNDTGYTLVDTRSALFAPPSAHPFWLRAFETVEWLGSVFFPRLGGVLIVEAEKQIYAAVRDGAAAAKPTEQWATAQALTSPRTQ